MTIRDYICHNPFAFPGPKWGMWSFIFVQITGVFARIPWIPQSECGGLCVKLTSSCNYIGTKLETGYMRRRGLQWVMDHIQTCPRLTDTTSNKFVPSMSRSCSLDRYFRAQHITEGYIVSLKNCSNNSMLQKSRIQRRSSIVLWWNRTRR